MLITLTFVRRFTMPNVDGNTNDTDWTVLSTHTGYFRTHSTNDSLVFVRQVCFSRFPLGRTPLLPSHR